MEDLSSASLGFSLPRPLQAHLHRSSRPSPGVTHPWDRPRSQANERLHSRPPIALVSRHKRSVAAPSRLPGTRSGVIP